jgi:hypothetical protein
MYQDGRGGLPGRSVRKVRTCRAETSQGNRTYEDDFQRHFSSRAGARDADLEEPIKGRGSSKGSIKFLREVGGKKKHDPKGGEERQT